MKVPLSISIAHSEGQAWLDSLKYVRRDRLVLIPLPIGACARVPRLAFDTALEGLHYAGACRRVGRCMRLLIMYHGEWVGGIVLGSTFPNVQSRDEALGLKRWCQNTHLRGLRSPWAKENHAYWSRLQRVVNHARTFVFQECQGLGIGTRAHRLLLSQGIAYWEQRYGQRVAALDTLCDSRDSALFLKNGWRHAGRTAGYEADNTAHFTKRKSVSEPCNNVALKRGRRRWEVWVKVIDQRLL